MPRSNNSSHQGHDGSSETSSFSRRGFLKRLSQMGAALGLGIAGVAATSKTAHACTAYEYEYKTEYGACGGCNVHLQAGHYRRRYRRSCRWCGTTKDCSAWTLIERECVLC
jgi:hypothetical protein